MQADNRLFGFRNQAGGLLDELADTQNYYESGVAQAVAIHEQGGINALLAFLANYQAPSDQFGGGDPMADFEAA
tara:strand:+ start:607 stop:828 length:222 start_codon:yes stop_codon:yes gene_type:complete